MPRAAPRLCAKCGGLVYGLRCETCKPAWDSTRGTRKQRGYGARWDKLRRAILKRDNYLCQPCAQQGRTTQATQVDHITPKAQGGTDDPANLQAICIPCHRHKTAREGAAGRMPPPPGA